MKKSKVLIITLIIIFSVCVIALSFLLGVLLTNSKMLNITRFDFTSKTEKIYSKDFLTNDIDKININSASSDIRIKNTNSDKIEVNVYGKNKSSVKVDISNNVLNIDYTEIENCIGFCFYSQDIEILIPKDYVLNTNIESEYGDIDIDSFDNGRLSIVSDSGDIDVKSIGNIKIESDYGDVSIDRVNNKLKIKSDSGDIEIETANLLENSEIISSYGDIEIGKINDIYVDAKTDLGDVKVSRNNRYALASLKIDSNYGDIEVGDD